MCMRFARESKLIALEKRFNIGQAVLNDLPPNYNASPTQTIAAVIRYGNENRLTEFRWGLVPSWAKDISIGNKMLNARGETVAEKPAFRDAFRKRRCIIPVDGYYEWIREGKAKLPVYIRMKDESPFGLAGLYETWQPEEDLFADAEEVHTCTIVTIGSNELIRPFHHRMPVVIPADRYDDWLDPENTDPERLKQFIQPFPGEKMKLYRVSPYVNSPRHNDPQCVRPVDE